MSEATTVTHLPREILDAVYAGAKQLYPRESFLLLRGKKRKGVIYITDLVLAPFAVHGRGFADFNPHMFSGDFSLVGTVHSHPSGNRRPSIDDLELFDRKGSYHIIVGSPFNESSWTCYNNKGEEIQLEVVDYKFNEEDENW